MLKSLLVMLCLTLATTCLAADRPAGRMGKVAMALACRALESRNPLQMADMAAILEADVFEKIGQRGIPYDVAELKREMAMAAMGEEGAGVRDQLSRLINHPAMTALFPVFMDEVPTGSAQVGRIGRALALFALKAPNPALKEAMAHLLAAHALERATKDSGDIRDVRTLKGILSMWAMSPEGEAVRNDLSVVLSDAQAMASLFPVFAK